MLSSSHVFFGDISRHQPAPTRFEQLLDMLATAEAAAKAAAASVVAVATSGPRPSAVAVAAAAAPEGTVGVNAWGVGGGGSDDGGSSGSSRDGGTTDGTTEGSSTEGSSGDSSGGGGETDTDDDDDDTTSGGSGAGGAGSGGRRSLHVYLAQQPLTGGLAPLLVDAPLPACLYGKNIASTNLWICGGSVRSSLHYDPHHNLLALVSGRKVVTLLPPYMTHCVYPMTLTGDAPNHSRVPFAHPHPAAAHPAYLAAMQAARTVELRPGDALFVPEGWWHQVDSGPETTIAVNHWWRSALTNLLNAPPPPPPPPPPLPPPPPPLPSRSPTATAATASGGAAAAAAPSPSRAPAAVTASALDPLQQLHLDAALDSNPPPQQQTSTLHTSAAATVRALATAGREGAAAAAATAAGGEAAAQQGPGPGLRNLFALRQLTRAAVDDVAEGLLDAVAPTAPTPQPPATVAVAIQLLIEAVRNCPVANPTAAADAAAPTAATAAPKPPPLPPYLLGLLLHLRPGESAALGLSGCPVASVLASLTPRMLAAALHDMCDAGPTAAAVSKLLTACCRVPAVACLLTRAFDQFGAKDGGTLTPFGESTRDGGTEGNRTTRDAGDGDGGGEEEEGAAAGPTATSAGDDGEGGGGPRHRSRRQRRQREGDGGGVEVGAGGGCEGPEWVPKRPRRGEVLGGAEASAWGRGERARGDDGGGGGSADIAADHENRRRCAGGGGGGAGSDDGSGTGGGGGSSGVAAAVPSDVFQRLYGTVEDPDEVFRLLLSGRAQLNAVARRILMEAVLS